MMTMCQDEGTIYIKPPIGSVAAWKLFLWIGEQLRNAFSAPNYFELFSTNEIEKAVEELHLDKAVLRNANDCEKDDNSLILRLIKGNPIKTQHISEELVNLLKNHREIFPFLGTEQIPTIGLTAISILSYNYAEKVRPTSIQNLPKLLNTVGIKIEDWDDEVKMLREYSANPSSLLIMGVDPDDYSQEVLVLSKIGFKNILGCAVPEEIPASIACECGFSPLIRQRFEAHLKKVKRQRDRNIPQIKLEDIVLGKEEMERVQDLVNLVRKKKGACFKILLYGKPGVGKTALANAICGSLKRTPVKADLAFVLDKWIGETEKNISRYFDQAAENDGVLIIDEADSLLRKRDAISPFWANNHVNHLLRLVEERNVSIIFCTNLFTAIDDAILRRLDEVIEIKMPNEEQRMKIWKKELAKRRIDGHVDVGVLKNVVLSGGLIANAVKKASRLKILKRRGMTIDTSFLYRLALEESIKMGKSEMPSRIGFC